jgi:hypothetical protein
MDRTEIKEITYSGGCDVIRLGKNYKWSIFDIDELIIGKKYNVIGSCCMQRVYVLNKDTNLVEPDDSGERYLYWKVENEQGEEICVWEGFFEENTHL